MNKSTLQLITAQKGKEAKMSNLPWWEESMLSAGATRDPEKRRQYEEHANRCRASMLLPNSTRSMERGEPPHQPEKKRVFENKKPTLLDIARRAIAEDGTANLPDDLFTTLKACWTQGAKSLGLTVLEYQEDEIPAELTPWLAEEDMRDRTGYLLKQGRQLGDIVEHEGRRLVLIAWLDDWPYAAFVPADEVNLD